MTECQDYLYIYLHTPKTAGSTLRYHFHVNFSPHELLHLSFDRLGLSLNKPSLNRNLYQERTKKVLGQINSHDRKKIKLIYGHAAIYGIHEYFDRPARYITFVRDPILRTASIYNHKMRIYKNWANLRPEVRQNLADTLLIGEKIPDFKDWLEAKYNQKSENKHLTMYEFWRFLGYITDKPSQKQIQKSLEKFYFIGLTREFSNDSAFIYSKLNINKFFLNRNISYKKYHPPLDSKLRKKILEFNKYDREIFNFSVKKRRSFILKNSEYTKLIKIKKTQRFFILPFTQFFYSPKDGIKQTKHYLSQKYFINENSN